MKVVVIIFFASLIMFQSCKKDRNCTEMKKEQCICPAYIDPVCGCNGKTYNNSCEAECAGIDEYTKGACR